MPNENIYFEVELFVGCWLECNCDRLRDIMLRLIYVLFIFIVGVGVYDLRSSRAICDVNYCYAIF